MVSKDQGLLAEVERDVLSGAPVADVLRKCIVIGGRAGSSELRDWATAELRGYGTADEAPAYRQVGAPIYADAVTGTHHIAGQRISPSMLPDFAQDDLKETYTFQVGIGEIEAVIEQCRRSGETQVKLSLPMAADLARLMDANSGTPLPAHRRVVLGHLRGEPCGARRPGEDDGCATRRRAPRRYACWRGTSDACGYDAGRERGCARKGTERHRVHGGGYRSGERGKRCRGHRRRPWPVDDQSEGGRVRSRRCGHRVGRPRGFPGLGLAL